MTCQGAAFPANFRRVFGFGCTTARPVTIRSLARGNSPPPCGGLVVSRPKAPPDSRTKMKTPTLGLIAAAILYATPAAAQSTPAGASGPAPAPGAPATAPGAPGKPVDKPDMEVYGTLLPFFEYVWTSGATPLGSTSTAPLLAPSGAFSGINHPGRFRMTSGTSHFGFRGDLPI